MIDYCSFINTLVVQLIFGSGLDEGRFPLSLTALLFFCLQNSGFPLTRMACSVYTKDCYLAPLSIRPVPPWTPFTIRAWKKTAQVRLSLRAFPRLLQRLQTTEATPEAAWLIWDLGLTTEERGHKLKVKDWESLWGPPWFSARGGQSQSQDPGCHDPNAMVKSIAIGGNKRPISTILPLENLCQNVEMFYPWMDRAR